MKTEDPNMCDIIPKTSHDNNNNIYSTLYDFK